MSRFVDEHRGRFGVEPICRVLGVSASAYYHRNSGARSARRVEDERLLARIEEVHAANYYAYGYRRTWKAMLRAGESCGRDRDSLVPQCRRQHLPDLSIIEFDPGAVFWQLLQLRPSHHAR